MNHRHNESEQSAIAGKGLYVGLNKWRERNNIINLRERIAFDQSPLMKSAPKPERLLVHAVLYGKGKSYTAVKKLLADMTQDAFEHMQNTSDAAIRPQEIMKSENSRIAIALSEHIKNMPVTDRAIIVYRINNYDPPLSAELGWLCSAFMEIVMQTLGGQGNRQTLENQFLGLLVRWQRRQFNDCKRGCRFGYDLHDMMWKGQPMPSELVAASIVLEDAELYLASKLLFRDVCEDHCYNNKSTFEIEEIKDRMSQNYPMQVVEGQMRLMLNTVLLPYRKEFIATLRDLDPAMSGIIE